MELTFGLFRFVGEISAAVAMSAWAQYEEKWRRN